MNLNESPDDLSQPFLSIWIGPVFVLFLLLLAKACSLSFDISRDLRFSLEIFAGDMWLIGLMLMVVSVVSLVTWRGVVWPGKCIAVSLVCAYALECLSISIFDTPLSVVTIGLAAEEFKNIQQYVFRLLSWRHVLSAMVLAAIFVVRLKLKKRAIVLLFLFGGVFTTLHFNTSGKSNISRYRTRILDVLDDTLQDNLRLTRYSKKEIAYYVSHADWRPNFEAPEGRGNMILLLVESLSAHHSLNLSQLMDMIPKTDEITREGLVFSNFISNYHNSAGATVALFQGIVPFPYPNASGNVLRYIQESYSYPLFLKKEGYWTEILSGIPGKMFGAAEYYNLLGFDAVWTPEPSNTLKGEKRYTLDSIEDRRLFSLAKERIKERAEGKQPYFLTIATSSTHEPFQIPGNLQASEKEVWAYFDDEFADFYAFLKHLGFFQNGILVVVGDHRKRGPITESEFHKYGHSSSARVPLFLIGKGVPSGQLNKQMLDQSHLFPHFRSISRGDDISLRQTFFVTFENHIWSFEMRTDSVVPYEIIPEGKHLTWQEGKPENFREVELFLHKQRSWMQSMHEERTGNCLLGVKHPGKRRRKNGIRVQVYKDTDIAREFDSDAPYYLGEGIADRIEHAVGTRMVNGLDINFSLQYQGYLKIEDEGLHEFSIESDDGVCFYLDRKLLISANYSRSMGSSGATIFLEKGNIPFELRYFQEYGETGLKLWWKKPGRVWEIIPATAFFLPAVTQPGSKKRRSYNSTG